MMVDENAREDFSVMALKSGDRLEFNRLVESTSGRIYSLALRMLGNAQDAEDVMQETYVKALRSLQGFEGRSSLSTWLHRIAINEALMHIRSRKPELDLQPEGQDEDLQGDENEINLVDWCCLPEEELLSVESKRHLNKALSLLPDTLRVVFILRDIEQQSVRETAELLNVSQEVVKTRLLRARLKLREHLSEYFAERLAEKRRNG